MKVADLRRNLVPDTWTADGEGALPELGPCRHDNSCVGCRGTERATSRFFSVDFDNVTVMCWVNLWSLLKMLAAQMTDRSWLQRSVSTTLKCEREKCETEICRTKWHKNATLGNAKPKMHAWKCRKQALESDGFVSWLSWAYNKATLTDFTVKPV